MLNAPINAYFVAFVSLPNLKMCVLNIYIMGYYRYLSVFRSVLAFTANWSALCAYYFENPFT